MTHITQDTIQGYYRYPAIYNETVVFTAEGDLWCVPISGGMARRLTTHHGIESHATIAPDGKMIAFAAQYEGATEVYTMPLHGGRPVRRTFEDVGAYPVGWTGDGKIVYRTNRYATLPDMQLRLLDPATNEEQMIPLAQASDGSFDETGETLFFTRLAFQGSYTKRYKGGMAQNIWKFTEGEAEAVPLTSDYAGTSKTPMWFNGRFYFASDRDGTMNLWSMDEAGEDLQPHTSHKGWDIQSPSLHNGRIVYQLGADLHLFQIESGKTKPLTITLASDFDQTRQRWVKNPLHYLTSWQLSPTGDRIVLTARGRVFIAPVESGRFVELTREGGASEPTNGVQGLSGVRYRGARFLGKDQGVIALSDATGELEFYTLAADGMGAPEQITDDGKVFRYTAVSSPDGNWLVYANKEQELWIVDITEKKSTKIATSEIDSFFHMRWSPDSRWLAYVELAENNYPQIKIYNREDGGITAVSSDRVDSYSPAWSPDGKWLYFLSDRHFQTLVPGPWGPRQPDPYFDKTSKIYMLALQNELRSPFKPADELYSEPKEKKSNNNKKKGNGEENGEESTPIDINLDGIMTRLYELPLPSGNYAHLTVNKKALFWSESSSDIKRKQKLVGVEIKNSELKPQTLAYDIKGYNLSQNGEKLLVYHNYTFSVFDAKPSQPKSDDKKRVDLSRWTFSVDLKKEWRQLFIEAWRLERDYFYDRNLHGIDWQGLLDRHLLLIDRITDRDELNHLIAQLVGELSALHTFVHDGDKRTGQDRIRLASLGATWQRDEAAGGYRIEHIYEAEPDYPDRQGPLRQPDSTIQAGDIITAINGTPTLAPQHPALLLQNQAGQQVRLSTLSKNSAENEDSDKAESSTDTVDTIVVPISLPQEANLRYGEWEYHNRLYVEENGTSQIGYVHLRAMSGENYSEWAQNYYAVFDRSGLIIDVRHNRGGNIDSWILSKLLRQAWFYWQPRVGKPSWNMQYAFRGHMVVLCNERTSSDGEAFSDGFRRLGLGKVIGTRTWGGEIWLSRNNWLVDKGIATAAQTGVYSADGEWLIEGHGFDPDMVVDNLPHATFNGADTQLDAAIAYLQAQIRDNPNPVPPPPPHPDKSFDYGL